MGSTRGQGNNSLPKIYMIKFDGNNSIKWLFQIEKFFDLHKVLTLQKVTIASLYLEPDQFVTVKRTLLSLGLYSRKK